MTKKMKIISILLASAIIVVAVLVYSNSKSKTNLNIQNTNSNSSVSFAQCLKNQGALFYGAFWCSHCQNQKAMFGSDAKDLPFVECSTPDGQGQLAICQQNNIPGYPTWVFKDGSRLSGELTLTQLAEKTGCTQK
ncbi:MAG: hypothetical protein WCN88_01280 [Candidatus Falkowbacteria bacterium]